MAVQPQELVPVAVVNLRVRPALFGEQLDRDVFQASAAESYAGFLEA